VANNSNMAAYRQKLLKNQTPAALSISNHLDESPGWTVQIVARCQEARDRYNLFGVAETADPEWDPLDYPEPPSVGAFVSVRFPHQEWSKYANDYTTDFRQSPDAGADWPIIVSSNIAHADIELDFLGLENLPEELDIRLIDEPLRISKNLKTGSSYRFKSGANGTIKNLHILAGNSSYLSEKADEMALSPQEYELSQNFPNPFNPATTIRFALPEPSQVKIRIHDLLGREIITLLDGQKGAGFHTVGWQGRDKNGNAVASGLYIYQIQAGKFRQARKMLLIQ
jgi:hypothetical protein